MSRRLVGLSTNSKKGTMYRAPTGIEGRARSRPSREKLYRAATGRNHAAEEALAVGADASVRQAGDGLVVVCGVCYKFWN